MKNRMIYQMKNKVRNLTYFLLLIGGTALTQSCSYLDVVPDKIGTIDNSFTNRNEAEKIAEKIRVALGYKPTFVTR